MSSGDALAAMRAKLDSLEAENGARAALLDRNRSEAVAESKEKLDKQGRIQGEVFVRLQERNRRAKAAGGWATEATTGEKDPDQVSFGFEDDEAENERRAGYVPAEEPILPRSNTPPTTAPTPAAAPSGRHRRGMHHDEDEDYTNTDWLAT
ncbi:hypothetical protein [Amycolatopsis benzoatilytica]|uniref:hypothetical protein n=1 Tax=Amycolatopsis benzoatilytica TaxID=346045 RepID=UPI00039A698B|nr:hypothetical protein [Amycolatopsis benzoatilytica]